MRLGRRNNGAPRRVLSTVPRPASAALCLALAAAGAPACGINIDHEGHIEREEKRFPAEGATALHLYTFDGAVEVRSWDRPEIVVEVEKRGQDREAVGKIQVIADRTAGRIQIEARHPGSGRALVGFGSFTSTSARLIATIPRKMAVVVRTGDGNIVVERLDGRLELRTSDGSIRAIETSGEILAESGDGSITLEEVSGRVEARTAEGTLRITGTPSGLRARSGDGSVMIRLRRGTAMREDWMVATDDGTVTVELPDDFHADIEAEPGPDGRTRSEFTLVNSTGGTRTDRVLRGRLGEGGHRLTLRTSDGSIRLSRY